MVAGRGTERHLWGGALCAALLVVALSLPAATGAGTVQPNYLQLAQRGIAAGPGA